MSQTSGPFEQRGFPWPPSLRVIADDWLAAFLMRQRWYPAKDAGQPVVTLAASLPFSAPGVEAVVAIWRVVPPGQEPLHIFAPVGLLPVALADDTQIIASAKDQAICLVEAFSIDAFVRAWFGLLQQNDPKNAGMVRLSVEHTAHFGDISQTTGDLVIERGGAQQSNTSIRIGKDAILKVFRKLEVGIHPEIEMGRFLTAAAGFSGTPATLGWFELEGVEGISPSIVSVLQAFVPNEGDGWSWVLGRLRVCDNHGLAQTTEWLSRLGERTAQMHRALAQNTKDPAFRPEPVRPRDREAWADMARLSARRTLDALARATHQLDRRTSDLAVALVSQRDALLARLAEIMSDTSIFNRIRHHGDYHLGQTLVAGHDAVIVDFEGEPLRPLAERRAKHAALRDVGGLLRSIAYAAATASKDQSVATRRRLLEWEAEASRAFSDAYFGAAVGSDMCPAQRSAAERLVHFFMLEKAIYEVAYELANRPDWVAIPLRALLALLDADAASHYVQRVHRMPFGAEIQEDGTVRFRLWAPAHSAAQLVLEGGSSLAMHPAGEGWHELNTDQACAGTRYQFALADGLRVPDPASRHQPEDVHGPSEVVDPAAYAWRDCDWRGRPWNETVLYELHVGAFTPEGTFRAVIDRLDHLVTLGVTAIEIMPIGDFPGGRNWGYDGVLPYAPDATYGRPEDLKALVEAAHERGLMVLLDVVYNHFGPDGAYQHVVSPEIFTDRHKTPWGAAINFDGADARPVREYFIHNALYWIEEYHLDGLRLDAVHAILDDSSKHLLVELSERVRAAAPDRPIHLVLENEENQASLLARGPDGRPRWYTAQWNDDVHHVLHVAASGEFNAYYADYHGNTALLGRALAEGFAYQGENMSYRGGPRGQPSASLPPTAFVAFIQNHDQVGNRAFGDRLTAFASREAVRAVAATYLLLPQVPMLFMGEEWAAAQPFPFFCDFGAELAGSVREGRRDEFARFPEFQDPTMRDRIPDPTAEATFESAKLRWDALGTAPHAETLAWYRSVLAMRRASIVPLIRNIGASGHYEVVGEGAVTVRWALGDGRRTLLLAANLSDASVSGFPASAGEVLWQEGAAGANGGFGPWTVRWSIERNSGGSTLDELAERMGIEPAFRDARGNVVHASAETKLHLLEAMGVGASDEGMARSALAELDSAEWRTALPPVLVMYERGGTDLTLPGATSEVAWHIALEQGGECRGTLDFTELPLRMTRKHHGQTQERRWWVLPDGLPWGYHRLSIDPDGSSSTLIVTPGQCWLPEAIKEGHRLWGIAAQLYLLRSATDWGIGDFGDLQTLVELAALRGADLIGLNPLHALFPDNPEHASPYSPASRLLLNMLNISVPWASARLNCTDLIVPEEIQQRINSCHVQSLVDYTGVAALKLEILGQLFDAFDRTAESDIRQDFADFRLERGEVLERHCLFLVLREHFSDQLSPPEPDWRRWPEAFRDPSSLAVAEFAAQHRHRVDFFVWAQWIADDQLGAAATAAQQRGMAVGLYRDLAVGADRTGGETWANCAVVVSGAQVGAPPDIHNPAGQDWGLPPFHPHALREEAYQSFIDLVRANMRHAGGLRIDHVMALQQLYWVPQGQKPDAGAYVRYKLSDLVGILALESHRHRCLVVGEDLGTVPEGFRDAMTAANILSYRVLYFEQDASGNFLAPSDYPPLAVAVVGNHDLPTLRGWWENRDIALKQRLGLYPGAGEEERQRGTRQHDKEALLMALHGAALPPDADAEPDVLILSRAAHTYLARARSAIVLAQIDDLTDEAEQVNVPATSNEHPNWRRRLSMTLEELANRPHYIDIAEIFRAERD